MSLNRACSTIGPIVLFACLANGGEIDGQVTWQLDSLEAIGGHKLTVLGEPKLTDTPAGKAIEFDGKDDALFLDVHPLSGWKTFTVEVVFSPAANGPAEQRFFHMQENGSESRVMFETRLVEKDQWFLDTFINTGKSKVALYAENHLHKVGEWYHAAIVVDATSFQHYVNGKLELEREFHYVMQKTGKTSIGVRINKVDWFKGAIRTIRFSPRPLKPAEFLGVED